MATYTVVPRTRQPGYRVDVVANDGARQSVLGFATEAQAQEWIEEDQKLEMFRLSPPDMD